MNPVYATFGKVLFMVDIVERSGVYELDGSRKRERKRVTAKGPNGINHKPRRALFA